MLGFALRRGAHGGVTIIIVSIILFVALQASGDPAAMLAPMDASQEDIEALHRELGLDKPIHVQYLNFWEGVITGEGGKSLRYNQSSFDLIWPFFRNTAELVVPAVLISSVLGVFLGVLAAVKQGTWIDRSVLIGALVGQAIPIFFLSLLLVLAFSVNLRWLPVSGTGSFGHFVLPVVSIAVFNLAVLVRLTRSSMIDVLEQDFIRTARAKGLAPSSVHMRHALRNASLEIVSSIGVQLGTLLSGVVVIEAIFAWPGIGSLMYTAVLQRDFPLVMVGTLVICFVVVMINILVDLSYAILDPRISLF